MSKPKTKSNNLPSLQKRMVLDLAETEPKTMNETAKAISKQYRPTWTAFKSLAKKNLIEKTSLIKKHRRQEYPRYWLTDKGIAMALLEGANPDKLLRQTKILYPPRSYENSLFQHQRKRKTRNQRDNNTILIPTINRNRW